MNPERVQNIKDQAAERWQQCEACASILGIDKTEVHNFLLKYLKDASLLEKVLEADQETIELIQSTSAWKRMVKAREDVIIVDERPRRLKKRKLDEGRIDEPESQIRAALWLIRQVGGVEQAKRAIEVAAEALNRMKGQSDAGIEGVQTRGVDHSG